MGTYIEPINYNCMYGRQSEICEVVAMSYWFLQQSSIKQPSSWMCHSQDLRWQHFLAPHMDNIQKLAK